MYNVGKINSIAIKYASDFRLNSFKIIKIFDVLLFGVLFGTLFALKLKFNFWHGYLMPLFFTTIALNLIYMIIDSVCGKNGSNKNSGDNNA